jgi:hypothetical protein
MTHNKNTNIALIYHALINTITNSVIVETTAALRKAAVAKQLIVKYFKPGSVLKEYITINDSILQSQINDRDLAFKYLDQVSNYINEADWKDYTSTKIAFLKEVKQFFPLKELTDLKFSNYRSLASVHLFVEACMGERTISKLSDKIKICKTLVENFEAERAVDNDTAEIKAYLKEHKIDNYTVSLALKEWSGDLANLSEEEQNIIKPFVLYENNADVMMHLTGIIKEQIFALKDKLDEELEPEVNIQVQQVISNLSQYKTTIPPEKLEEVAEKLLDVTKLMDILNQ